MCSARSHNFIINLLDATTHIDTTMSDASNQWIGDGQGGSTLAVTGEEILARAAKSGTPFNVRYANPLSKDFHEFAVSVVELEGNASVGLVTKEEFLPGWKTRGMFYNGNVTNGSASLITSFGKYVSQGDVVGVRWFRNNDATEVQFLVNGKNLGTAFCLSDCDNKIFYPCLHVSGTLKFVYRNVATNLMEHAFQTEATTEEEAATGYEGDWKLQSFEMNGNKMDIPSNPNIILTLDAEPTSISVKVGNTLRGSIQVTGRGQDEAGGPGALDIKVGPLMSTMMMPPPPLDGIERTLSAGLPKLTKLTLAMGYLYMTGTGMAGPELTASRYTNTFQPLTKY